MTDQYIYSVLLAEFPYFKKLETSKRDLLCQRTKEFIEETKFVGKQGLELTDRMKILIAACSQQLTLSFKKHYLYSHFDRIFVYPQKYYSPFSQTYNVGEMNTAGVIVFSWEDFYNGIQVEDNRNVGLHEFAHALEFMDIAQKDLDKRFSYALDKEFMIAQDFITNNRTENFFRSYALTNRAEFFAVATEYFFESPLQFSEVYPDLYILFCKIYGQDLRRKTVSFQPILQKEPPLGREVYIPSFLNSGYIIMGVVMAVWFFMLFNGLGNHKFSIGQFVFMSIAVLVGIMVTSLFSSFSLHENGIKIHRGLIDIFYESFNATNNNFSYDDVFTVNLIGNEDYKRKTYLLTRQRDSIPSLRVYYYDCGRIRSASSSLEGMDNIPALLKKLYLEKQVCVRINGKIKRFELQQED